jgi:hypothetical protein
MLKMLVVTVDGSRRLMVKVFSDLMALLERE